MKTTFTIESSNSFMNGQEFDNKEEAEKAENLANLISQTSKMFVSLKDFNKEVSLSNSRGYVDDEDYKDFSDLFLTEMKENLALRKAVQCIIWEMGGLGDKQKIICGWNEEDFKNQFNQIDFEDYGLSNTVGESYKEEIIAEAMEYVQDNFDANTGVTWETIEHAIVHCFKTIEIEE